MKILVGCSTLDLKYRLGCTPSWWQLFKALHENGHEVIVVPYLGDPVESLWWRSCPNPCSAESKVYNYVLECRKRFGTLRPGGKNNGSFFQKTIDNHVRNAWSAHLLAILAEEHDVDAVLFITIPLTHITGIAEKIRHAYTIPVGYYEGDMPIALPHFVGDSGYKFSYYDGADLSEFDAFFTNSKGVIPELENMGARNIRPLYYAADPDLFRPVDHQKDIDVSFFGYGNAFREEWMTAMITRPSQCMKNTRFSVAGGGFSMDLGKADCAGDLSFSDYRKFTCRSRICLNITRRSHASVYASSTARPFELAAFGACMVSQPYEGIEEWFEKGKDLIVIDDKEKVTGIYSGLLSSGEECKKLGENARKKIVACHTWRHRAQELTNVMKTLHG